MITLLLIIYKYIFYAFFSFAIFIGFSDWEEEHFDDAIQFSSEVVESKYWKSREFWDLDASSCLLDCFE